METESFDEEFVLINTQITEDSRPPSLESLSFFVAVVGFISTKLITWANFRVCFGTKIFPFPLCRASRRHLRKWSGRGGGTVRLWMGGGLQGAVLLPHASQSTRRWTTVPVRFPLVFPLCPHSHTHTFHCSRLRPNVICSPSQGPCCTGDCKLKVGNKCREDNGCRTASYCNGQGSTCPPSTNKANKTICNEEYVCYMGVRYWPKILVLDFINIDILFICRNALDPFAWPMDLNRASASKGPMIRRPSCVSFAVECRRTIARASMFPVVEFNKKKTNSSIFYRPGRRLNGIHCPTMCPTCTRNRARRATITMATVMWINGVARSTRPVRWPHCGDCCYRTRAWPRSNDGSTSSGSTWPYSFSLPCSFWLVFFGKGG